MKKAVIACGGIQHLVAEGDEIVVNYVGDLKTVDFTPLALIEGKDTLVDGNKLSALKVSAKVVEDLKGDKVISIRYKAKKRVNTKRGHRQKLSKLSIVSIK
ncbi:50S ribosomal protein L21 [Candidatus Saccharibacteria bacterium]|nr:50S ribosomal protein L21 [Candidatus Saccharibacteria bacterium]